MVTATSVAPAGIQTLDHPTCSLVPSPCTDYTISAAPS